MKMATSAATIVTMSSTARSGATALTSRTVTTPSSSAAAARKARLKRSSVWSDGVAPAARVQPVKPCRLLALRLAFLVRWCRRRRPDVDRAGLGRVDVLDVGVPAVRRGRNRRRGVTSRLDEVNPARAVCRRVLHRVREIRLFSGHQVPKVGLHRSDIRLLLGVRELRDRDGGKNADDHHHDQQLNERETLAVHLRNLPIEIKKTKGD